MTEKYPIKPRHPSIDQALKRVGHFNRQHTQGVPIEAIDVDDPYVEHMGRHNIGVNSDDQTVLLHPSAILNPTQESVAEFEPNQKQSGCIIPFAPLSVLSGIMIYRTMSK